jgi:hypothetical protein
MSAQDPNFAREAYQEGVKNFWPKVGGRARDPKTGRYAKQAQGQQAQTKVDPFYPQNNATLPNREKRLEKAQGLAAKSRGTDDDLEAMLAALLPMDDSFVQYG